MLGRGRLTKVLTVNNTMLLFQKKKKKRRFVLFDDRDTLGSPACWTSSLFRLLQKRQPFFLQRKKRKGSRRFSRQF
jgi:hypothetical protein